MVAVVVVLLCWLANRRRLRKNSEIVCTASVSSKCGKQKVPRSSEAQSTLPKKQKTQKIKKFKNSKEEKAGNIHRIYFEPFFVGIRSFIAPHFEPFFVGIRSFVVIK